MMGILSTMSDFERNQIKERQMEGIRIRKERGLYGGRKIGSKMDTTQFLQKEKSQKIIEYLKKGYTHNEISKILRLHITTHQCLSHDQLHFFHFPDTKLCNVPATNHA